MKNQTLNRQAKSQLAIFGGTKTLMSPPPKWPFFDKKDYEALQAVLESGVWGGYHESVREFEQRFATHHNAKYGIAVANGTLSLEIALTAAGVRPGDEVIVPPITFVASASAVARIGAFPVFVDVDPETLNLNPTLVARAISRQTRAIVLVHFAGCPAELDSFLPLCKKQKLVLIEDCAHAHGAEWNGQRVGSFGNFGSFSFQGSKNMTAGEGGILITNNARLAESARSIANQGRRTGGAWYEHVNLGTNARLTGFQATLLINQLERLPQQVATRMKRAASLRAGLSEIKALSPTPEQLDQRVTAHAFHLFSMRYDPDALGGVQLDRLVTALQAEGLPVTKGYPYPIYRNEVFDERPHTINPCSVAEAYCRSCLWLPQNVLLADEEWIALAIRAIKKVCDHAGELQTSPIDKPLQAQPASGHE